MKDPAFSIVMPVYNGERHLREAVASVQAQTERSWELIAVDDGSSDGSRAALISMAAEDGRIVVKPQQNAGVAAARNAGMRLARGEFVTFMDQDDVLHPRALETMRAALETTGADAASGRAVDFLTTEGARRFCASPQERSAVSTSETPVADVLHPGQAGRDGVRASVWARCYRRSAAEGLTFPDGVFGADDWVFTMRFMAKARKVAYTKDVVYLHRAHPDNVTSAMPARYILAMLDAVSTVAREWCDDPNGPKVPRDEFARSLSSHIQLWGMMLPALKRYMPEESRRIRKALVTLRSEGLLPFVSASHAIRYALSRAGLGALLPVLWRGRFRNMARARANHASEVG